MYFSVIFLTLFFGGFLVSQGAPSGCDTSIAPFISVFSVIGKNSISFFEFDKHDPNQNRLLLLEMNMLCFAFVAKERFVADHKCSILANVALDPTNNEGLEPKKLRKTFLFAQCEGDMCQGPICSKFYLNYTNNINDLIQLDKSVVSLDVTCEDLDPLSPAPYVYINEDITLHVPESVILLSGGHFEQFQEKRAYELNWNGVLKNTFFGFHKAIPGDLQNTKIYLKKGEYRRKSQAGRLEHLIGKTNLESSSFSPFISHWYINEHKILYVNSEIETQKRSASWIVMRSHLFQFTHRRKNFKKIIQKFNCTINGKVQLIRSRPYKSTERCIDLSLLFAKISEKTQVIDLKANFIEGKIPGLNDMKQFHNKVIQFHFQCKERLDDDSRVTQEINLYLKVTLKVPHNQKYYMVDESHSDSHNAAVFEVKSMTHTKNNGELFGLTELWCKDSKGTFIRCYKDPIFLD